MWHFCFRLTESCMRSTLFTLPTSRARPSWDTTSLNPRGTRRFCASMTRWDATRNSLSWWSDWLRICGSWTVLVWWSPPCQLTRCVPLTKTGLHGHSLVICLWIIIPSKNNSDFIVPFVHVQLLALFYYPLHFHSILPFSL